MHSYFMYMDGVNRAQYVLILVLMEDALALELLYQHLHIKGLNPCSNGRCTRTKLTGMEFLRGVES